MNITDKSQHDPVTDIKMPGSHLRSALLATEEVVGKQGMAVILRQAGLDHLIDNYPPDESHISGDYSFDDYSKLNAALLSFLGRGGRSVAMRIGRKAYKVGESQFNTAVGGAATAALRLLPESIRLLKGVELMKLAFDMMYRQPGTHIVFRVEDRGDRIAFIAETCGICAGKVSDEHMCQLFAGLLQEGVVSTFGKEHAIQEVECRANGAPACVWEISKIAKE